MTFNGNAMTKAEKIADMLAWSLEGCQISSQNERSLRQQFAAKPEQEIDHLYAMQMKRRGFIARRTETRK